jgi:hypothetical protein
VWRFAQATEQGAYFNECHEVAILINAGPLIAAGMPSPDAKMIGDVLARLRQN